MVWVTAGMGESISRQACPWLQQCIQSESLQVISPIVPKREMNVAGQRKQVYLWRAPHLEQTPHQLPVQPPFHGMHHVQGQIVTKNFHTRPMNHLQLSTHRYLPLIQEHRLVVQHLGVNSLLLDVDHCCSIVGLSPDHLAE